MSYRMQDTESRSLKDRTKLEAMDKSLEFLFAMGNQLSEMCKN